MSRVGRISDLNISEIDGRTRAARRFRDVLAEISGDLGGTDHLSEGQKQLARRAAMMSVQCEVLESEAVTGKPFDLEAYGKLSDRLGRTFARLGLKRVARDVAPDLHSYIANRKTTTIEVDR